MTSSVAFKISTVLINVLVASMFCLNAPQVYAQDSVPKKFTAARIDSIVFQLVDDDAPDEKRLTDKQSLESRAPLIIKKALQEAGLQIVEAEITPPPVGLVAIRTTVKYNPGNQALRWLSGPFLGKGKGKIDIHIEAINPATNQVITSIDVQDTTGRFSMTGGNFYNLADSTLEGATEDLANSLLEL